MDYCLSGFVSIKRRTVSITMKMSLKQLSLPVEQCNLSNIEFLLLIGDRFARWKNVKKTASFIDMTV